MNKRDRMKMRIENHGEDLRRIFGLPSETDAETLAKRVHRIEVKAHRMAENYCNGDIDMEQWNMIQDQTMQALNRILKFKGTAIESAIFVNGDPRGYALKIDDEYVRAAQLRIYRDWGGYGILAPEFDGME